MFFELNNLLSLSKTYAKTVIFISFFILLYFKLLFFQKGIKLCKKVIDDSIRINGLFILFEVKAIEIQMSAMQEQYLRGNLLSSSSVASSLTNEKRNKKMDAIRNEIARVQRRLYREKHLTKQSSSPTAIPELYGKKFLNTDFERLDFLDTSKPVGLSKSLTNVISPTQAI